METPTIREICDEHNLRLIDFSNKFDIPYRTAQDWYAGLRQPQAYVTKLIVKVLEAERRNKQESEN